MSVLTDAMRRCIAAYKDLPVLDAPPADMNDCEHKWSLMRVPYECPYCLRERVSALEAEIDRQRIRNKDINDALRTILHDNIEGMERERIEQIAYALNALFKDACAHGDTIVKRNALLRERDALRALLREAQDRSVYLAAPATDDHSISLRERIDAALGEKP